MQYQERMQNLLMRRDVITLMKEEPTKKSEPEVQSVKSEASLKKHMEN